MAAIRLLSRRTDTSQDRGRSGHTVREVVTGFTRGEPPRVEVGWAIDQEELTRWYRDYGPVVHRRARRILGNDEEAEDALQEVFVRAIGSAKEFRGEGPALAWIYRITTNLCLNRLRQRASHPVVVDPEAVDRLLAGGRQEEDRQAVLQVLARLDPLTQELALYHYVDGMNMEEVAQVVGYSRKTVGKKLAEFRAEAQRLLGGAR